MFSNMLNRNVQSGSCANIICEGKERENEERVFLLSKVDIGNEYT